MDAHKLLLELTEIHRACMAHTIDKKKDRRPTHEG
jgi:hypothetical protein